MRSKKLATLFLCAVFSVAALTVWPGCISAPLPSARRAVLARKKEDFKFTKPPQPSRVELVIKLGEPDFYFENIRVACYRVNEVTRRRIWLCLGIIPMEVQRYPGDLDVAFIEFDEQDRVRRSGTSSLRRGEKMEVVARKWFAEDQKKQTRAR